MHIVQGTVEKQREQIRDLDSELSNVKADLEELKGQNDRLSTSNKVGKYHDKDSLRISSSSENPLLCVNVLGATEKVAAKPKSAPLPCG